MISLRIAHLVKILEYELEDKRDIDTSIVIRYLAIEFRYRTGVLRRLGWRR